MHPVWGVLPGVVLGVALQLLQMHLWPLAAYLGMLGASAVLAVVALRWPGRSLLRSALPGLLDAARV